MIIDNYSLRARFYPVVLLLFPILILGSVYSFEFSSAVNFLSSLGIVSVFIYLFSQLGRDRGKSIEPHLWKSWGGAPSSVFLRFRDQNIDSVTKKRYHTKLLALCPVDPPPTIAMENTSPNEADECYQAWTKFLIGQTRDEKKYPLLIKENTSYGFRRNMYGLKPHAIVLLIFLMIGNYFFWVMKLHSYNPIDFPISFRISTTILFAILIFWISTVTHKWIKIPALAYASRLLEAIDSL